MHELTRLIWNRDGRDVSPQGLDSIIRAYLSEKAKELIKARHDMAIETPEETISRILGLSPSSEVGEPGKHNHATQLCYEGCGWNGESYKDDHKPKDSEVWCEHIVEEGGLLFVVHVGQKVGFPFWYNNCPICGKRRPRREPVKTLEEKIDEFLRSPDRENDFHGKGYLIEKMAREHFKQV